MAQTATGSIDAKKLDELILRWRNHPEFYVAERLGQTNVLEIPHQLKMLAALRESLKDGKPVVFSSAHAMGKDFLISGRASLWFVECFAPCKVIMTGPTDRQVREIMWSELEKAYNGRTIKDPFGRLLTCKLDIEEDWFVLAFTTKETGAGEGKFQGYHSPRIMIVVSEAQKVEEKIYDQIEGITTSGLVLQCYLGNPTRTTGRFAKMIRDTTRNRVLHLNAYDSPNVIQRRQVIPGLVDHKWVEDKEARWNSDKSNKDPRFRSKVLGLLPNTSINTVISEELFERAVSRQIVETVERGAIGVDPARWGDDDMVISVFRNGVKVDRKSIPKCDATAGAAEVVLMQKKHFPQGQIAIGFDCDGMGGPFLDIAKKMVADELEIVWVEFHGSCSDREIVGREYENHRAEAAFYMREQMEAGLVAFPVALETTKEEAMADEYFINPRSGRIQLIDKDEIKEVLGRSPNDWDADKVANWSLKFAPIIKKNTARWRDNSSRGLSSILPNYKSAMGA